MTYIALTTIDGVACYLASDAPALITETTDQAGLPASAVSLRNAFSFTSWLTLNVQGAPAVVAAQLDPNFGGPAAFLRTLPIVGGPPVIVLAGIARAIVARPDPSESALYMAAVNPAGPPLVLVVALSPAALVVALT